MDERHVRAERRPCLRHLDPDHAPAEDRPAAAAPASRSSPRRSSTARPRRARGAAGSRLRCPSRSRRRAARRGPPRPRRRAARPRGARGRARASTPRSSSQGTIEESSRSWTTSSRRASTASTSSSPTATPGTRRASAASSPGPEKRLRRHAGEERALAAHEPLLDDRHRETGFAEPSGGDFPGCPGADHDDVELALAHVTPPGVRLRCPTSVGHLRPAQHRPA